MGSWDPRIMGSQVLGNPSRFMSYTTTPTPSKVKNYLPEGHSFRGRWRPKVRAGRVERDGGKTLHQDLLKPRGST